MAKIQTFRRKKGKQISKLKTWKNEKRVFILQMKKSPDGKVHRDHLAAIKLGIEVKKFTLVTANGNERVWGIQGSRKKLESLQLKIGQVAYELVKAEGGGKRHDRPLKERWQFNT